jgi:hypothetical protein
MASQASGDGCKPWHSARQRCRTWIARRSHVPHPYLMREDMAESHQSYVALRDCHSIQNSKPAFASAFSTLQPLREENRSWGACPKLPLSDGAPLGARLVLVRQLNAACIRTTSCTEGSSLIFPPFGALSGGCC